MLTEIFYHIDNFCKMLESATIETGLVGKERKYKTFKDYYTKYVLVHMKPDFRLLVSYGRFVELKAKTVVPLTLFVKLCCKDTCTGISIVDSFALPVCNNRRIHEHTRHRSPINFLSHACSALVAYCFKPYKPSIAQLKKLVAA